MKMLTSKPNTNLIDLSISAEDIAATASLYHPQYCMSESSLRVAIADNGIPEARPFAITSTSGVTP